MIFASNFEKLSFVKVLEKADVVCCTLSCAGSQPVLGWSDFYTFKYRQCHMYVCIYDTFSLLEVALRITGFQFDAVIIDEAGETINHLQ